MPTPFETYISSIEKDLKGGKATELTYRSAIEVFMESLARGIQASSDPKHIECGAPDFIVEKGRVPLGYVETKDVGVDLNKIEKSDQMKRYLKALHNLILTDYLEFRWYVNGEKKLTVRVADVSAKGKLALHPQAEENINSLFREFYATETPTVTNSKELASRLAGVTHFIRDRITDALQGGDESIQKALEARYNAFRELLLPALKPEEFADLYAQAMTYGLFAAKLSATPTDASRHLPKIGGGREGAFTLQTAYQYLFGNKFLRRLFSDVSEELDEIDIIRPYLLDIVSLLNRANFASILADFGKRTRTEDPVVHFYETFLAAYDPKLRESRGVYYTPEPVVQFIVRSVDELLKSRFGKAWGLADSSVKVLDPATGTGTFLYYVIQQIHEEVVTNRKQAGQWQAKSRELLGRIFGFELLIAPYVVSHLKLGLLLKTLGAPLAGKDDRLHVFLTNTLEEGLTRAEQLQGLGHYIAEEASDAAHVKKQEDIMVVLGNPPYSNFGMMNKSEWIQGLIEDYKKDLGEKKINLDDDYIKFIRFGQWRIEKTGQGVLALITNHSYIDGLTHRRMRQSLLETFSNIYVLDLHGNTKRKEKSPDGSVDENVFDIQQGVSIVFFVKESNKNNNGKIYHADLWGTRESKYRILAENNIASINWSLIEPKPENYFFIPKDFGMEDEYTPCWSVKDIFPVEQNGLKTDRDELFFDFDKNLLATRMKKFYSDDGLEKEFREKFRVENSSSYDLISKRQKSQFGSSNIVKSFYRPFDFRWLYYSPKITSRPAWDVMKHIIAGDNLGLIFMRQAAIQESQYSHFCVSQFPVDNRAFYSNKGIMSFAPLYLYTTPEETAGTLFAQSETTRKANLAPAFIKAMEEKLEMTFVEDPHRLAALDTSPKLGEAGRGFTPEDVFYYAYAVFHNPTYRKRYAEFLKIDFPRLPLTSNKKLFAKLVEKGKELVDLHLLKSPKVEEFITAFPVSGDNKVEKVLFTRDPKGLQRPLGSVWINASQYFDGIPENVWEFQVGGYQVCEKWLKDRRERVLSGEDVNHYQRVIVSLKETIRLMKEIDKAVVKWPME